MARKGVFIVFNKPVSDDPEVVEAYNRWYDEHHVPDSLLLPGWIRGRRFKLSDDQLLPFRANHPGFDYVAIYEIEDLDRLDEAKELVMRLPEVSTAPEFFSPALDQDSTKAFIFEMISDITEATPLPEGVEFTAGSGA